LPGSVTGNFEIVVCEDNSPKSCEVEEVVNRYINNHVDIDIIFIRNSETLGYDGNFRKLIDVSNGQYCVFMGDDDLMCAGALLKISEVVNDFKPDEVLIPHLGDIHSDHRIIHEALLSCTKWFRYNFVKRILSYETLSETNFGLNANEQFCPNVYFNISGYLDLKIKAMEIYSSEIEAFPFPRSKIAIKSLAKYRGSTSGFEAAEAFQLLREIK